MERGERARAFALMGIVVAAGWGVLAAPKGDGHAGDECAPTPLGGDRFRLEAECFDGADAACDPDGLGEHTNVTTFAGASGGRVVTLPRPGCGVTFPAVSFLGAGQVENVRVQGSVWPLSRVTVTVTSDGAAGGSATVDGGAGLVTVALANAPRVRAGLHDVRVRVDVTGGSSFEDVLLDYLEFVAACRNSAPIPPVVFDADAMGAGNYGWARREYRFTAAPAFDADGDAIAYLWRWGDGATSAGLAGVHAYATAGSRAVALDASDDPTRRAGCVAADAFVVTSPAFTFTTIRDWSVRLARPVDGESCIHNRTVPSFTDNLMASGCQVEATLDTGGGPATLVQRASFQVDGLEFRPDFAPPWSAFYSSLAQSTGEHAMRACAWALWDKYDRRFCSAAYEYVNVGIG